MKQKSTTIAAIFSLGISLEANAALTAWQTEVTSTGETPTATVFTTVSGFSPQVVDVGTLSGDRSFEFIVNADLPLSIFGASLLGAHNSTVNQAIRFQQVDTGNYGIFEAEGIQQDSGVPAITNQDVHLAFVWGGINSSDFSIYENGTQVQAPIILGARMTGQLGLGAALFDLNIPTFGHQNALHGNILGFASYNSALTPAEITAHSNAFAAVPEPSSIAILSLGGIGLILRRRR